MGVPLPEDSDSLNVYLSVVKDESERRQLADEHLNERLDGIETDVKRVDSKFDELREDYERESKETRGSIGKAKIWIGIIVSVAASAGPELIGWLKSLIGH